MRIAIVGTGAMGSVYAGYLAEGGHEVLAYDTWTDHMSAIRQHGLRIDGPDGSRRIRGIRVIEDMASAVDCDLVVIATKARDAVAAASAVRPVLGPNAVALTIQNGLGAGERVGAILPAGRVLLGVAEGFGASVEGPGHVAHTAMRCVHLGDLDFHDPERLETVGEAWRESGFPVRTHADILPVVWEKFLCNVALSGSCTAIRCTVGELLADPERWAIGMGCMREAYEVAQAEGTRFSFEDPVAHVTGFARDLGHARPSMLLDHMAERPSELDAINGQVSSRGRRLGIATPYNDTLVAVLRAREAPWTRRGKSTNSR